jgi:hypothetical protein
MLPLCFLRFLFSLLKQFRRINNGPALGQLTIFRCCYFVRLDTNFGTPFRSKLLFLVDFELDKTIALPSDNCFVGMFGLIDLTPPPAIRFPKLQFVIDHVRDILPRICSLRLITPCGTHFDSYI